MEYDLNAIIMESTEPEEILQATERITLELLQKKKSRKQHDMIEFVKQFSSCFLWNFLYKNATSL